MTCACEIDARVGCLVDDPALHSTLCKKQCGGKSGRTRAHVETTFPKKPLNVAIAQDEPGIKPHCVPDDRRRKLVMSEKRWLSFAIIIEPQPVFA